MKRYRSILTRKLSQASSVYEVKHIAYLEYIPGAHTILCPLSAGISTFAVCFAVFAQLQNNSILTWTQKLSTLVHC